MTTSAEITVSHKTSCLSLAKRVLASMLRILAGIPIVCVLVAGLLLAAFGVTPQGRMVGLSLLMLGSVLFLAVGYWNRPWFARIRLRLFAILIPLSVLLYGVPLLLAPNGDDPAGRVRNCFLGDRHTYPRYAPSNVIPEVDQLTVGVRLFSLGPTSMAEASRISSRMLPLYQEMNRDPGFRNLGSAMGWAYSDLAHQPFNWGHYFAIVPANSAGNQLPCLIFLHGIGGNSKPCLWILAKLSQTEKCVVLAPTFGFGNWDRHDSAQFVVDVAQEAIRSLPINPKRIFLMGYSNGAMGVTRAALAAPQLFCGQVYLSPVTEDELFCGQESVAGLSHQKILFLHGECDQRIPAGIVRSTATSLERLKANVTLKIYPNEDHYLIFSQPDAVMRDVARFMTAE